MSVRRPARLAASVAVIAFILLGSSATSPAAAARGITVEGSVTIVDRFTFFDEPCTFVHGVWDGEFRPHPGGRPWELHVDECTVQDGSILILSGSFTLVAPGGSLTGTIFGAQPGTDPEASYDVEVTGGTRRFRDAGGALRLSGTWDTSQPPAFVFEGTLTGTLTR